MHLVMTPPQPVADGFRAGLRPPQHDQRLRRSRIAHASPCPTFTDGRAGGAEQSRNATGLSQQPDHAVLDAGTVFRELHGVWPAKAGPVHHHRAGHVSHTRSSGRRWTPAPLAKLPGSSSSDSCLTPHLSLLLQPLHRYIKRNPIFAIRTSLHRALQSFIHHPFIRLPVHALHSVNGSLLRQSARADLIRSDFFTNDRVHAYSLA